MVKTSETKEIKIEDNKQVDEETLKKEGWILCGMKYVNKDTIVVFERLCKERK